MSQIIINSEAPELKALEKDGNDSASSEVNMQQFSTSSYFPPCLENKTLPH